MLSAPFPITKVSYRRKFLRDITGQTGYQQRKAQLLNALGPADIQKMAAKYFDTYRAAVVIVGDYAQVKDQVAPFGDVTLIKK